MFDSVHLMLCTTSDVYSELYAYSELYSFMFIQAYSGTFTIKT